MTLKGSLARHRYIIMLLIMLILALVIPIILKNQLWLHLLTRTILFAILGAGVRLVLSVGEVSLGHAGFFAIGAYTSALLVMKLNLSYWLAFPLAGIVTGIIGAILGYLIMRSKGPYFFLITFIIGVLTGLTFAYFEEPFGGSSGIVDVPSADPIALGGLQIDFDSKVASYYLIVGIFFITMLLLHRIQRSRLGLTFGAINQSDSLAESLGINVTRYKVLAFTIACFFAGLAGSFYSQYMFYVSPAYSNFWKSIEILVIAIVGGTNLVFGPIAGAFTLGILGELARELGTYYDIMLYSIVLILIVRFMPEGLAGGLQGFVSKFTRKLDTRQ